MKRLLLVLMILCLLPGCGVREAAEPQTTPPATAAPTEATAGELPTEPAPPATQEPTVPPEPAPTQEPTIPPEPADEALVRVLDYIPTARQALAYATEENFTGQRVYDFADAYLRYGTVKKLIPVCEELAEMGLGILIWDGFRPLAVQWDMWEMYPDPAYVSHPETGSRAHCRGSAIDLTLVDLETGELLKMPTGFDDFSALADRDYSDCPETAAANARLLETVMEDWGFKPYSKEWWHFSDRESYPVDEEFQPPRAIFTGGVG